MIAALILQRPLLAGLVVLVVWFAADRAWFSRTAANRWLQRRRLEPKLRASLEVNPHDRDARFQLAELLLARGRHDRALELIEKNLAAGDEDDETLFVAGVAAFGSSTPDAAARAQAYLERARQRTPTFRGGAVDLALGRGRLLHDQFPTAREALQRAIEAQPGSVEAHVLLARAYEGQGQTDEAARAKAQAWRLYREAPRFKRRQTRSWAWRANPMAAVRYGLIVVAVVVAIVILMPRLVPDGSSGGYGSPEFTLGDTELVTDGFDLDLSTPPTASRFQVTPGAAAITLDTAEVEPERWIIRWDLDANGVADNRLRFEPGDVWCRLRTVYPDLPTNPPRQLLVVDTERDETFAFWIAFLGYALPSSDPTSVYAFETLLQTRTVADCRATFVDDDGTGVFGVRDGAPFQTP